MQIKQQLQENLKNQLSKEELALLPAGFQVLGEIIILNLNPELIKHEKAIANEFLKIFPKIETICNKTGKITGKFREPQIKVIISRNRAETIATVKENNCIYKFDVTKLMFAKGNINERIRIAKQVKKREIVIDMFAGLGYFSIPIGKIGRPKKLYSIELNPNAFHYLKENLKLNHINNAEAIFGDNRIIIEKLEKEGIKADRIVMGYLPPPKDFLPSAFKIAKKGTIIHYEDLLNNDKDKLESEIKRSLNDVEEAAKQAKTSFKVKLIKANFVKNYKPHVAHYVLDVGVE